ncbi:D-isomer specific 2-hydroxyacid dehydrogenase family protein [Streptomyces sp. DSM 41886]|uniref:D-isomer specific 2-hydroxyacid dehydrogenase family protein n=1 Tax=Streptomyces johnsoniae TaxID=3075532 RepID=A0ABU2RZ65_9ACTN|nr:D-isomer specific 2-hydroxyacid dehydrogenase family protein [Streptomyces sp. DSM 41886]
MTLAFANNRTAPGTLLLISQDEVPGDLLSRLDSLVRPVWRPDGDDLTGDGIEILVTANRDLGGTELAKLPDLRLVVTTGTAYDYVDTAYCEANGIAVCNTPGYTGSSVAEHAIALYLAANRHLTALDGALRTGAEAPGRTALELAGRTAGVVGAGDIGARICAMAQGLGMRARFANRSPRTVPGAVQVDLEELLATSDVVFLCLPLTAESHHLLNHRTFSLMRPSAFVVNISSDELIDPKALAAALENGSIAGAGLDVIGSAEPYLGLPNVVLTPARGWYTAEGVHRRAATWLGTIESALAGRPAHRVV